ncbi:MAG: 4-hydroxythreonine-4-phosphate dehydrogenase PdxA [Porticoccaceae bacterium]|jgi:4-hydroxythreonine-4-phosphate dehydrogenase|nr:4-hydroxythreonine-4-phosphate dehydrogenase PdxA [Porticoccaceae bacterium]MBT4164371.1 4-hydroxythreonine-4-phosphate dehydrogenase PdxA [Porticoccaceae bacterium]MBT4211323.1 4-hydroxythreonine-4-phosphate dehydrogenase PdxA [Porticoccaceae bacterium]MBT4590668.1 4-hydroxythreonine-4-phosphate dehydrogenase PdxA [Porticoccaceae bacterium]MBT5003201.1 4-hydroxythreonine-4-phosphate dehydrogenase PdxA [Porticoccaceae bacterium]
MTLNLALTPGEPSGVGPDLLIQLAQQKQQQQFIAFADPDMLAARATLLGLPLKLVEVQDDFVTSIPGELAVIASKVAMPVEPGLLNQANAPYVLNCLDAAIASCEEGLCQAMVTGPVQKSIINDAGIKFSGHTEYLAEKTNSDMVVMMLATEELRVALTTTHLPLREVPDAISVELLMSVIDVLYQDLQNKFGIKQPTILVSGLNPHAGEGGHMGHEEIDVIAPVISHYRDAGRNIVGPLPADTLFTEKHLKGADAVLVMYHDQGLPVLKYQGFGRAANITLGLPIIRTSVDHGTALDIAGTGSADIGSLQTAIKVAVQMASAKI